MAIGQITEERVAGGTLDEGDDGGAVERTMMRYEGVVDWAHENRRPIRRLLMALNMATFWATISALAMLPSARALP